MEGEEQSEAEIVVRLRPKKLGRHAAALVGRLQVLR